MEEYWSSGTWVKERCVEFECFGSTFAVDVEGNRRWGVAVQDLEAGTQLHLNRAIAGESCAPDHYPEFLWQVIEEGKSSKGIVGVLFEEFNACIWEELPESQHGKGIQA